jgi:uncharacterized protein
MTMELFAAISLHDLPRVGQLLAKGADPSAVDVARYGWTPLHAAVEELEHGGDPDCLILLLRYGADPNAWDTARSATPLLMALFRGHYAAARMLLSAGAEASVLGSEGDTPLRWCVSERLFDFTFLLLACGAYVSIDSCGGIHGMTALGIAAQALELELVELLLAWKADPLAQDGDHMIALQRMPPRTGTNSSRWDRVESALTRS